MGKVIAYYQPLGRLKNFVNITLVMFFLFSFHVLVVYYLKNIFGYDINSLEYIMVKMWKELLLVAMIVGFVLSRVVSVNQSTTKLIFLDYLVTINILLGVLFLLIAENLLVGLWSFRSLFEIYGFYVLGRVCSYSFQDYRMFFRMLLLAGVLTSIFGVIQVEYLGVDFFYDIYGVDDIAIALTSWDYEKLRASSSFISPHEFGLFLVISIISFYYLIKTDNEKRKIYFTAFLIIIVGLIYSLSRSSYVILFVFIVIVSIKNRAFVFYGLAFLLVSYFALDALGILANIQSIFSGEDTSSSGRLDVLARAIDEYMKHPLGSGLGSVGVVVRRFNPEAPQFEGEIFNILVMLGPAGIFLHLLIYWTIFQKAFSLSIKNVSEKVQRISMVMILVIAALFLRELILPRDFTNYSIGWFLIGNYMSLTNALTIRISGYESNQ